jgi:hypothetical protein
MATDATNTCACVFGALEVRALMRVLVALQAALVNLVSGDLLKCKDFGFIATTVDVRRPGSMAGFTAMEILTLGSIVQAEVRRSVDVLELGFVTTFTGF